jgi:hypothetical protein
VLRISYSNAQSIFSKLNELSAYAVENKPDIILLTETWCNTTITDANLSIPNYQLETELRRDRADTTNGIGGGLLVYSKIGLKILPSDNMGSKFHQFVSFKVLTKNEPVNIVLAYRPPNSSKENTEELCKLLRELPRNSILIGDINLPDIDWNAGRAGPRGSALLETMKETDLEQLVRFPTHDKGNTLDLVITNMAGNIISVQDNGKLGRSDHCIIATDVSISGKVGRSKVTTPNWSKADMTGLRNFLGAKDWDSLMDGKTVEESWEILKEAINQSINQFVPKSTVKGEEEPKWINREIIKLIRKKRRAWKLYKQFNNMESRDRYKDLEKEVTKKIRNAKRGMEKKLANSKNNNARTFASYIKSKTKTRVSIGPIKNSLGELVTGEKEMAEELNKFFGSVFTEEDDSEMPQTVPETNVILSRVEITEKKVEEKIKNLRENSATGPDGIGPKVLKAATKELVKPLCHIYRESMRTGVVPKDWKHARVTPIYKKGAKGEAGNYRPVSITSIPCRMLESVIKDAVMTHLMENKLIKDSQHGFLKGRSCTTNLTIFMDKLTQIVDKGTPADIFYLDFAKAFDKVPHQRLLLKVKNKGIGGEVLNWIKSWLADRTQTVRVGASESTEGQVKSGVPQGSVLGPPLFDVFIDDLDYCAMLIELLIKFADDTKGLQEITGEADRVKLQSTLDRLVEWARVWGMQFNVQKCKIMHVGNNNPRYEYQMAGTTLSVTEEEKDIGVTMSRNLKPSKHCRKAAGTAGAVLRQLTT